MSESAANVSESFSPPAVGFTKMFRSGIRMKATPWSGGSLELSKSEGRLGPRDLGLLLTASLPHFLD